MTYLLTQMLMCLVAALVVGAVIGWWLKHVLSKQGMEATNRAWEEKIRASRDETRLARSELAQSRTETEKLAADLDGQRSEVTNWETRFQTKEEDFASLEVQLKEAEAKIGGARRELSEAQKTADERLTKVNTLDQRLSDEKQQLSRRDKEIADLRNKLKGAEKFETESKSLSSKIVTLTTELTQAMPFRDKFANLETEMNEYRPFKAKAAQLESELGQYRPLKDQVAHLETELAEYRPFKDQVAHLETELNRVRPYKDKATELESELGQLRPFKDQTRKLEARIKELEDAARAEDREDAERIAQFREQLKAAKETSAQFEAELGQYRGYKDQAAKLELRIRQLEDEARAEDREDAERIAQFRSQLQAAKEASAGFEKELDEHRSYKDQATEFELRIKQLEEEARAKDRQDAARLAEFRDQLEAAKGSAARVEKELQDARQNRVRVGELQAELHKAQSYQSSHQSKLAQLESQLSAASAGPQESDIQAWRVRLERQTNETRQARAKVNEQSASISRLEAQIKTLHSRQRASAAREAVKASDSDSTVELERLRRDLTSANRIVSLRDRRIAELQEVAKPAPTAHRKVTRKATPVREATKKTAKKVTKKVARQAAPSARATPKRSTKPSSKKVTKRAATRRRVSTRSGAKSRDDLKKIHGVGPVLEKLLNKNGVYYFKQVAGWNKKDISKVSSVLEERGWFPGRIQRDKWLSGARKEHFKKYGKRLPRK